MPFPSQNPPMALHLRVKASIPTMAHLNRLLLPLLLTFPLLTLFILDSLFPQHASHIPTSERVLSAYLEGPSTDVCRAHSLTLELCSKDPFLVRISQAILTKFSSCPQQLQYPFYILFVLLSPISISNNIYVAYLS